MVFKDDSIFLHMFVVSVGGGDYGLGCGGRESCGLDDSGWGGSGDGIGCSRGCIGGVMMDKSCITISIAIIILPTTTTTTTSFTTTTNPPTTATKVTKPSSISLFEILGKIHSHSQNIANFYMKACHMLRGIFGFNQIVFEISFKWQL